MTLRIADCVAKPPGILSVSLAPTPATITAIPVDHGYVA
jgi:hypothetical protein